MKLEKKIEDLIQTLLWEKGATSYDLSFSARFEDIRKRQIKIMLRKTGNTYKIVSKPPNCRIEKDSIPAYAYQMEVNPIILWIRPQSEMEDGRFTFIRIIEVLWAVVVAAIAFFSDMADHIATALVLVMQ